MAKLLQTLIPLLSFLLVPSNPIHLYHDGRGRGAARAGGDCPDQLRAGDEADQCAGERGIGEVCAGFERFPSADGGGWDIG